MINANNVGRIAERIAMNELEARGFHITDLAYMSKTAANVDFIASKNGRSINVQVKGATWKDGGRAGIHYGYCDDAAIEKRRSMFNSKVDFAFKAEVIILVAVNSPSKYRAIVMPVEDAERAAQINLDGYHRQEKVKGGKRAPSKIWTDLEGPVKPRKANPFKEEEREYIKKFEGLWDSLGGTI